MGYEKIGERAVIPILPFSVNKPHAQFTYCFDRGNS